MGRRNRVCYLCGETYSYCPTCLQDKTKPAWLAEFHNENCVKIFSICTRFNMKSLSKDEAKLELSSCDLSEKDKFISCVKRDLDIIFAPNPKPKRASRKVEVAVMQDRVVETAIAELPNIPTEQLEEVVESHEVVIEKENI